MARAHSTGGSKTDEDRLERRDQGPCWPGHPQTPQTFGPPEGRGGGVVHNLPRCAPPPPPARALPRSIKSNPSPVHKGSRDVWKLQPHPLPRLPPSLRGLQRVTKGQGAAESYATGTCMQQGHTDSGPPHKRTCRGAVPHSAQWHISVPVTTLNTPPPPGELHPEGSHSGFRQAIWHFNW